MRQNLKNFILLAVLLLLFAGVTASAAQTFDDVSTDAWYAPEVQWAVENRYMTGYDAASFGPADSLTRGQFAAIIYRLAGEADAAFAPVFSDVEAGKYYSIPVLWCAENGIISGYDSGAFGPDDPITREQITAILLRYARLTGADTRLTGDLSDYSDGRKVSSFAKSGMAHAIAVGIINGDSEGHLRPGGNATRAEIAAVLHRFLNSLEQASGGFVVCIDPGHYQNANIFTFPDGTSYCEGNVTLEIAKALRTVLEEEYGISAYLTRSTGSITIDGYTNGALDNGHIALRGAMAREADLFVSVHTNGNAENANDLPTCFQPLSLNKPVILVNDVACYDADALNAANLIGENIEQVHRQYGLSGVSGFQTNSDRTSLLEWTGSYNDTPGQSGTVCVRKTSSGGEYYGVLRGASNVGTPGMIIEHGYHTVPEVREAIAEGDLIMDWARADAEGIARALENR